MKSLEEVAVIKTELEKHLLSNPAVSSVNIGPIDSSPDYPDEKYGIRVYVNNKRTTHTDLGINKLFRGVPVIVEYRKITLQ
jgi:hypothetical protein